MSRSTAVETDDVSEIVPTIRLISFHSTLFRLLHMLLERIIRSCMESILNVELDLHEGRLSMAIVRRDINPACEIFATLGTPFD